MPLFEFRLNDLQDVMPWRGEENQLLHWFGLTDGYFYMNVNGEKLFHLSDEIIKFWNKETPGDEEITNFIDYQVVRSYEDLLEILPNVLESIPKDIHEIIKTKDRQFKYESILNKYRESLGDNEDPSKEYYSALEWFNERHLVSLHLKNGPEILFWSYQDETYIRWNNENDLEDGIPIWSACSGQVVYQKDTFKKEVLSFHERLMQEMENRIEKIINENPIPHIKIDIDSLLSEHRKRKNSLNEALSIIPKTSWSMVRSSIETINNV